MRQVLPRPACVWNEGVYLGLKGLDRLLLVCGLSVESIIQQVTDLLTGLLQPFLFLSPSLILGDAIGSCHTILNTGSISSSEIIRSFNAITNSCRQTVNPCLILDLLQGGLVW
jgi:hypothetical protein